MELLNFKLTREEREILDQAAKLNYDATKHRKNYSAGSFAREKALASAKRLIAKHKG